MSYKNKLRTLLDEIAHQKAVMNDQKEDEQKKIDYFMKRTYLENPERTVMVKWRTRHQ